MSSSRRRPITEVFGRLAPRSLRGKIVASTVALMAVAMIVVVVGIQLLLGFQSQRDIDRVLEGKAESTETVIEQASATSLTVPADGLEPGILVYDSDGNRVAGSIQTEARDAADDLATTDVVRTASGPGDRVRLRAVPFTTPSGEGGVLVVSQETAPYERSEFYALLATGALGMAVVASTALVALRVTRQALAPVTLMAERAAEWSEHDLTHRFDLGPPTNELAALGETLDHLLDRVASAIRSEQRLTAELAHELRTPLTSIQGSADLALLQGVDNPEIRARLVQISASTRAMGGVISTLLDIAREGSVGSVDSTCTVADVVQAIVPSLPEGVDLEDDTSGSTARIAAPSRLVARAVQPLVDNATRHATARVTLRAVDGPERILLTVADDGPGVSDRIRDTLFEPGVTDRDGGAGLGLGIAIRVARSFGADITLDAPAGGSAFTVSLPRR
jgi:two-component system OmpR family sensor kinase